MQLKTQAGNLGKPCYIEVKIPMKIHIMGICGTAMSSLAGLLKSKGHHVQGSDQNFYPPISDELKQMGIPTFSGYKEKHIHSDLDLVVVGNVISKKMPEAQALLKSNVPYMHLPEALNAFVLKERIPVMVCGTHGKTTVSGLCAHVLQECGWDPGFMVGGVLENFKRGYKIGRTSSFFVVEGDEYDTAFFEKTPKFLHYHSVYTLLNNIEFDHGDIYKDLHEVEKAFRLLMEKKPSSPRSCLIAGVENPLVKKLLPWTKQRTVTYGVKKGDWTLQKREPLGATGQKLWVKNPDQSTTEIETPLLGLHNALNVLSVWVWSRVCGLNKEQSRKTFKSFKGIRRRFQVLGDFSGVTLIEDFAHHPTAVSAVLQSTKEHYPNRRVLAIFEPRSNTSRTSIFQKEYEKALSVADLVFCLKPRPNPYTKTGFSTQKLVTALKEKQKPAFSSQKVGDMVQLIKKEARTGDVALIMSNGDFGDIYTLLKKALSL